MKKEKINKIIQHYYELKGWEDMPKEFYKENGISYSRHAKRAKQLLELCDGSVKKAKEKLTKLKKWAKTRSLSFTIETLFKKWPELC